MSGAIDLGVNGAERLHGPLEKIPFLVTDNGSCFLARDFPKTIKDPPQQLGLLERFQQSLKRNEVYWELYNGPQYAREKLDAFRGRYNGVRPHWALEPPGGDDVLTPQDVYVHGAEITLLRWQGWAKAAKTKLHEATLEDAELRQAA